MSPLISVKGRFGYSCSVVGVQTSCGTWGISWFLFVCLGQCPCILHCYQVAGASVPRVNHSPVSSGAGKLPSSSAYSGLHMALCAVNLAECAEEKIPPSTMAEIHLTAAVGLKTRCGGKLGFLAVSDGVLCTSRQSSGKGCEQPQRLC